MKKLPALNKDPIITHLSTGTQTWTLWCTQEIWVWLASRSWKAHGGVSTLCSLVRFTLCFWGIVCLWSPTCSLTSLCLDRASGPSSLGGRHWLSLFQTSTSTQWAMPSLCHCSATLGAAVWGVTFTILPSARTCCLWWEREIPGNLQIKHKPDLRFIWTFPLFSIN